MEATKAWSRPSTSLLLCLHRQNNRYRLSGVCQEAVNGLLPLTGWERGQLFQG